MTTVAAGIILCQNKILIAQRKRGKSLEYLWEFPGGKLEQGETLPQCLKREIQEEFEQDIEVGDFFMTTRFDYDFGTIEMHAYWASCPTFNLPANLDHEQYCWVLPEELKNYDFPPADKPIVDALSKMKLSA